MDLEVEDSVSAGGREGGSAVKGFCFWGEGVIGLGDFDFARYIFNLHFDCKSYANFSDA